MLLGLDHKNGPYQIALMGHGWACVDTHVSKWVLDNPNDKLRVGNICGNHVS